MQCLWRPLASAPSEIICEFGHLTQRNASYIVQTFFMFETFWCCLAGAGTALLGKEAAMACTVAVEEVISEHYDK